MFYFPEPYSNNEKKKTKKTIELVLSNYAIKYNWERAAAIDTSKFAKKVDLTSLK